jgi:outer membrane cobalamin receptor
VALRPFVLCISLLIVIAWPAQALADAGSRVGGRLVDPAGAVVAGATVTLTAATGLTAAGRTDAAGRFDVGNLLPGAYELHVTYPGLSLDPLSVILADGEHRELDLHARLSALTDVVVVTAGHVADRLATTPSPVTVFTEQDIVARQIESGVGLLRLTPGFSVAQSGGPGALASAFPRGGESDYTLVLVDGIRVNSMGGGFDFGWLPVSDVARVEIVRGPQSAVHGADAIGGVMHVITQTGGPTRATGFFEGGSHDSFRAAASAAGSWQGLSWGASVERSASDGFNGTLTSDGERVSNDDGDGDLAAVNGRYAAVGWSAGGHLRVVRSERGYPGPFGSDPNGTYGGVDRVSRGWNDQVMVGGRADATISPRVRLSGSASYADLDSRFRSPYDTSFSETRRVDARGQVDWTASQAVAFTGGVEVLGERGASTYITGQTPAPLPVRRRVTGAFVESRMEMPGRLSAAAGLRVEHIVRSPLESDGIGRPAFGEDAIVSANPRLAMTWLARAAAPGTWSWTRLRATAGTGIRPPDAFEIAFTDNPDLAPERSRSYDAGVEQALFDGRAIVDAAWFDNRYDDLIVAVGRDFSDASRYRTDNIANARARGLEVGLVLRPLASVALRGAYTWLDSEILAVDGESGLAPSPFVPGDSLVRRPRHQGWVEATVTHGRGSMFARFGARGRVLDVDPSFGAFGGTLDAAGFAVADAGASVTLWRRVAAFGRVTNLLDRRYEEALGFPAAGRTLIGGVRVAAGG